MNQTEQQKIVPVVGMGATEPMVTDTMAHVIVRISESGKTLWTRYVETGEAEVLYMKGPWPVTREEGLLDKPHGDEIQWRLNKHGEWRREGWRRLFVGQSYRRVDYSM